MEFIFSSDNFVFLKKRPFWNSSPAIKRNQMIQRLKKSLTRGVVMNVTVFRWIFLYLLWFCELEEGGDCAKGRKKKCERCHHRRSSLR